MYILIIHDRLTCGTVSEVIQQLSHVRRRNCLGNIQGQDAGLLMQVFHGGGAEDSEESHPQGGALEGNNLVGLSLFGLIV